MRKNAKQMQDRVEIKEILNKFKELKEVYGVVKKGEEYVILRHGKWIIKKGTVDYAECSLCNGTFPGYFRELKYCPNCGAKMDLEE